MKILLQVLSCGRGFGKSMLSALVGLFFADVYSTKIGKPLTVLIVSSQQALYSNLAVFFRMYPALKTRLLYQPAGLNEIPEKGIQFKDNFSSCIPRMATIHSVEGYRADVIIFDESQDIPESVFLKAIGCLKHDIIGKVIVIGTPYTEAKGKGDKPNWFKELVKNPKGYIKGYKFHLSQYPSDICNWNPHKMWKSAWSKERYDAECVGKVTPDKERSYFPTVNITNCCYDIEGGREGTSDSKGKTTSVLESGIDCGYHNTGYILVEWITNTKIKVLFIGLWKDKSIENLAPELAKLLDNHNPTISKIDSRQGANVPSYKEEIKKYTHKTLTAIDASLKEKYVEDGEERIDSVKKVMLGQLSRHLRERHLIIPMRLPLAPLLVEQLKKYNPRRGINDDLVDTLMLAIYRPLKPINIGHIVGGFNDVEANRRVKGWWKSSDNWL